jgi:starch synthase
MLRVLFVTTELGPGMKSGGLGEISHSLPAALLLAGVDVRILVPAYPALLAAFPEAHLVAEVVEPGGALAAARLLEARLECGVPLILLDCPAYYRRAGSAYQDAAGEDFADNALRFGLLSKIAAVLATRGSPYPWRPDIIHCNDWPCALAPAYLHFERRKAKKPATVMTVHNLAFQGLYPPSVLPDLGLPPEAFAMEGVEFWGSLSFMKAGLYYADRITTVSPRYALEILDETLGYGLAGLLRWRSRDLAGILNGIDTAAWNPATDPLLAQRYDFPRIEAKAANKAALQKRLGLAEGASIPLLGLVSRFTEQKGVDLIAEIAEEIAALPAQLALLGTGDKALERNLARMAARHPGQFAVTVGFDEELAHLIEAGSDIFLMPSRFEPCGLNQMYSLRYGTPPIVHATGGLADTVVDCTKESLSDGSANGFAFGQPSAQALLGAVRRAVSAWNDTLLWRKLQENGMKRDFGWARTAGRYRALYEELALGSKNAVRPESRTASRGRSGSPGG